ncbi:molybdopterin-dependent oxidoreductase [Streptomyces spectabilis]|uniref:Reductase n=1 Tax=Streptomyces spectabilis TaxID=68270 RepID=A0A5P2X443_STRST|nr:molybdopterin-dependent oxidoreductase [Streptomyces spectabilis]MBB5101129.1 DMSO/TMAO reductase YedYZ molybdopterin-dependent catalytic subunit [Streptomyces spectabilis]MCI3900335.1 molybdopterin-dependent oxidoreductase [Streptomyces spectabilis]QEV57925.1 reductase [Streptomyces spectabilis]GGV09531.1 sulfite oxidase-like oxidoreductase [Streptomyces spectabilis]
MTLPPGQRAVDGFPRFGSHLHRPPPPVPADPVIEIGGALSEAVTLTAKDLAELPRQELGADFHCVAGWSATGLVWEGVAFDAFYRTRVEPLVPAGAAITHVVFEGFDGYRSVALLQDALAEDVLIADRLDGRPLDGDHGAPVRLVSPSQYGFVSTKHLCRITFHTSAPPDPDRWNPIAAHSRGRVWQEERHRYLPGRVVRPVYRGLIGPIRRLSARGSRP